MARLAGVQSGVGGKGLSKTHPLMKRHRKILRDIIKGITKPAVRRLARRGGVKCISLAIYDTARSALRDRVTEIMRRVAMLLEHTSRKTVSIDDIIYTLNAFGTPIYGFDDNTRRRVWHGQVGA
ncbi:hypothetical protein K402DRAFT_203043 [Aulographum hederae CBS 113979]|uniref:Histone H4 n=1 Tax=Aulographum hederae CBS 113979 TaxID=1176131 RepID=A0A6G1HCG7_9PEZI|nr:hypothetical protein K402DRAFT_203043 [Aulographum hederae CBS 113979]